MYTGSQGGRNRTRTCSNNEGYQTFSIRWCALVLHVLPCLHGLCGRHFHDNFDYYPMCRPCCISLNSHSFRRRIAVGVGTVVVGGRSFGWGQMECLGHPLRCCPFCGPACLVITVVGRSVGLCIVVVGGGVDGWWDLRHWLCWCVCRHFWGIVCSLWRGICHLAAYLEL